MPVDQLGQLRRRAQADPVGSGKAGGRVRRIELTEVEDARRPPVHPQHIEIFGHGTSPERQRVQPIAGIAQDRHVLGDRRHAVEPRARSGGAIVLAGGEIARPRRE